jgi:hypothetical protein
MDAGLEEFLQLFLLLYRHLDLSSGLVLLAFIRSTARCQDPCLASGEVLDFMDQGSGIMDQELSVRSLIRVP